MTDDELTLAVLRDIREEAKKTNERLDRTNERLDQTNERLDQTREELSQRIVEGELRTATAITELAGTVGEVRDLLREGLTLRDRVARNEGEILRIKDRLGFDE